VAYVAEPASLKRVLSLPLLVFYGLGTILGAGIYVLVGKVAGLAGMYAPVSFLLAAVLTLLTGLTYTELCARFPHSAGSALYVQEGFGFRPLSLLVGWLIVLTGIVSSATLALGFVGYLRVFVTLPDWLVIGALVLGFGLLAIWGISESVTAAAVATVIEVGGLLLILAVAGDSLAEMPSRAAELVPSFEAAVWQGIVLGAFLAFYAYIGFEDMVTVVEEVKDPQRNLPRAIVIAMVITTILYLLVALAAVLSLPLGDLVASDAPLARLYEQRTGRTPLLISFIGLFAVANGVLIQIIMSSRMLYGMSREGWQTELLGRVHPVTRTPVIATALVTLSVFLLALALPLVTLAQITSFIILVVFTLINLALLRIKRRAPAPAGVRAIPAWVPLAGFAVTAALILFQAADWLGIGR
jgi:amino acid transporter